MQSVVGPGVEWNSICIMDGQIHGWEDQMVLLSDEYQVELQPLGKVGSLCCVPRHTDTR